MNSIIKSRRLELGLQLKDVADYVGVSPTTVSRWEKGDISSIKDKYIIKLSTILRTTPNSIVNNDSDDLNFDYSMDDLVDICKSSLTLPELEIISKGFGNWSDDDKLVLRNLIARFIYIGKHPLDFQKIVAFTYPDLNDLLPKKSILLSEQND